MDANSIRSDAPPAQPESRRFSWTSSPLVWLTLFLSLGLAVRLLRYLLNFPLWQDELMLAVNLIDHDYVRLLGKLDRNQIAPPGFLWVERWMIETWGVSEWSFRFPSAIAGVFTLPVFVRIACLVFPNAHDVSWKRPSWPAVAAFGLFATSYFPLRYSCELKPYGIDLFTAAVLLWFALEFARTPARWGWLAGLTAVTPLFVSLSFPVVLAAGGIVIGLVPVVWKTGCWRRLALYATFPLVLLASFSVLRFIQAMPAQTALSDEMASHWTEAFPPHTWGPALWAWLVRAHTSELLAYPFGGEAGASTLTAIACMAGAVWLGRRKGQFLLAITGGTLSLLFVAAWLRKYPYGGHPRLVLFFAPHACLLAAAGFAAGLDWLARRRQSEIQVHRIRSIAFFGLLAIALTSAARDVSKPFKSQIDYQHRAFAREFWSRPAPEGWQTVCLSPHRSQCNAPRLCDFPYRVERALSLPQQHPMIGRVVPPKLATTPIRCVVFQNGSAPRHEGDYWVWRRGVAETHDLVAIDRYDLPVMSNAQPDLYEVYWFQPIVHSGAPAPAAPDAPSPTPARIASIEGHRL
jgi:hypothetical protein